MALILRTPRKKRFFTFEYEDGTTDSLELNSELEAQVHASNLVLDKEQPFICVYAGPIEDKGAFLFEVTTSEEFYGRNK